jgi:hypothetical protein
LLRLQLSSVPLLNSMMNRPASRAAAYLRTMGSKEMARCRFSSAIFTVFLGLHYCFLRCDIRHFRGGRGPRLGRFSDGGLSVPRRQQVRIGLHRWSKEWYSGLNCVFINAGRPFIFVMGYLTISGSGFSQSGSLVDWEKTAAR